MRILIFFLALTLSLHSMGNDHQALCQQSFVKLKQDYEQIKRQAQNTVDSLFHQMPLSFQKEYNSIVRQSCVNDAINTQVQRKMKALKEKYSGQLNRVHIPEWSFEFTEIPPTYLTQGQKLNRERDRQAGLSLEQVLSVPPVNAIRMQTNTRSTRGHPISIERSLDPCAMNRLLINVKQSRWLMKSITIRKEQDLYRLLPSICEPRFSTRLARYASGEKKKPSISDIEKASHSLDIKAYQSLEENTSETTAQ